METWTKDEVKFLLLGVTKYVEAKKEENKRNGIKTRGIDWEELSTYCSNYLKKLGFNHTPKESLKCYHAYKLKKKEEKEKRKSEVIPGNTSNVNSLTECEALKEKEENGGLNNVPSQNVTSQTKQFPSISNTGTNEPLDQDLTHDTELNISSTVQIKNTAFCPQSNINQTNIKSAQKSVSDANTSGMNKNHFDIHCITQKDTCIIEQRNRENKSCEEKVPHTNLVLSSDNKTDGSNKNDKKKNSFCENHANGGFNLRTDINSINATNHYEKCEKSSPPSIQIDRELQKKNMNLTPADITERKRGRQRKENQTKVPKKLKTSSTLLSTSPSDKAVPVLEILDSPNFPESKLEEIKRKESPKAITAKGKEKKQSTLSRSVRTTRSNSSLCTDKLSPSLEVSESEVNELSGSAEKENDAENGEERGDTSLHDIICGLGVNGSSHAEEEATDNSPFENGIPESLVEYEETKSTIGPPKENIKPLNMPRCHLEDVKQLINAVNGEGRRDTQNDIICSLGVNKTSQAEEEATGAGRDDDLRLFHDKSSPLTPGMIYPSPSVQSSASKTAENLPDMSSPYRLKVVNQKSKEARRKWEENKKSKIKRGKKKKMFLGIRFVVKELRKVHKKMNFELRKLHRKIDLMLDFVQCLSVPSIQRK